jgi:squalene-hopene/tetraprenyl-beta-curcumene cyclase
MVSKLEARQTERATPQSTLHPALQGVARAIERAQSHLLSLQYPDGYWMGELIVDTTIMCDLLVFRHWEGKVNPRWELKAVNYILSRQMPGGGWNIFHGGPAEVNATIKAYLALKLAGVPVTDPRGVPRMNTFSKLNLAVIGLYPWKYVPTIPCEVLLIGKWFHVNFWDMSNWSRAMLVPLAIINHFRPTRHVGVEITELFPEGYHERDLRLPRDPWPYITWRNFFLALDKLHKFAEVWARAGIHPFRRLALKKAEAWIIERMEGSDGLAAIFPGILNSMVAFKALGYPDDHPLLARCEQDLAKLQHENAEHVWMEPCQSPVWDTAIVAIAMRESGLPADHPAMKQATEWLLTKEIRFRGDWVHKNPVDVEPSGWVFEFENKWNPDVDDTAMVLLALRQTPTGNPVARDKAYRRGLDWMMTFQCRDGGWAAFDKDCTNNILEKVPFADHNAMLDPECADITARILEVLGHEKYPLDHPQVVRALDYLRKHQEPDGSWYGRWGVNYIYGTWQVLRGLHVLGLDMQEPWLRKAGAWLEAVQNPDGGWGERCDTYEDPVFKGGGPSTASQTAWAVMGLCTFGDPHLPSLVRGIDYLARLQNPDGSWTEEEATGTGFPRVYYLKYDLYRNSWPLLALATFRKLVEQAGESVNGAVRTLAGPLPDTASGGAG